MNFPHNPSPDSTTIKTLIEKTHERAAALRRLPESTYRLQFHKDFKFADAAAIIPYLAELGITHVYASPYLRAAPGSTHGYDVIDHRRLNPELGCEADYEALVQTLSNHGMTHILDTVPNHAGIATNENNWWNDVLEHGPASRYGKYFDIAWNDSPRAELHDRVLLPILGKSYAKTLEAGELKLAFDPNAGSFAIAYYARRFPLNPSTYGQILDKCDADDDEFQSIRRAIANLPSRSERDAHRASQRCAETAVIKRRLAALMQTCPQIKRAIEAAVEEMNGIAGDAHGFDALDELLAGQCYRLAYWHTAADEINYRRFFDINDLAALSMEREDVFEDTHAFTLKLAASGKVAGLRIDHPDGLYDPEQYFRRLQQHYLLAVAHEVFSTDPGCQHLDWESTRQQLLAQFERNPLMPLPLYVVAEKILAGDEKLPREWEIDGASGYQFLNMINGIFVDPTGEEAFTKLWTQFTGDATSFEEFVYQKKLSILNAAMGSELSMLTHRLARLAARNRRSRDFTHHVLRDALAQVIACFPVYRTYITGPQVHQIDRQRIETAISCAKKRNPQADADAFDFVGDSLLQRCPDNFNHEDQIEQLTFAGKFQQLTAPVTAKGVEDTAFYIYNRLVSLNEVGGDPSRFGIGPEPLHAYLAARQKAWPHALSALSTHDTKRSEDVRARLNVLSELPEQWGECVRQWQKLNRPCELTANEEYLLYQALIGAWPLEPYSPQEFHQFIERIKAYLQKAMREAKLTTSWTQPNESHEKQVAAFIDRILRQQSRSPFLASFRPLQRRVAHLGLLSSLSQTLLKLASPGVPDTYQGTELWDFSLVDPDNRRPVDYEHRRRVVQTLHAMQNSHRDNLAALAGELIQNKEDGRIKFWITWQMLQTRRQHPGLFSAGSYIPLKVSGTYAHHVFAFARQQASRAAVVVIPRFIGTVVENGCLPLGEAVWKDTTIELPESLRSRTFRDIFTGQRASSMHVGKLLSHVSVATVCADD
jgi:(1->4)-alpha-D-glucan 1-alpha-D-glucosylmutase